ncbi:TPA: hypothetical protein DCR49_06135 [Candidatus Delongbacteria bacterium]|nr:hypothetical protein [Candidatus Delongbacteria bacterium]
MKRLWILLIPCSIFARVFLISDLNFNSRSSGLRNSDFALVSHYANPLSNPAFLALNSKTYFSSTYFNHFEDINSGSLSFAYPDLLVNGTSTAFSLSAVDYGSFSDIETGYEYNPYDVMLTVSQGLMYRNILLGANLKYVYSSITSEYSSGGFIVDVGSLYRFYDGRMSLGAGLFDVGFQTDKYYESSEEIDFHLRTGISYELEKMPLKMCFQYDYYFSELSRYAIGLELDAKKNLTVRAGYDFSGTEKEIGANDKIEKFGGLSLGTSILIDAFGFDFSYIINGELDAEFCATLEMQIPEIFK